MSKLKKKLKAAKPADTTKPKKEKPAHKVPKIGHAWPASPSRAPKGCLEFRYKGHFRLSLPYYSDYAIRHFIDAALAGHTWEWSDGKGSSGECLRDESGLEIEGRGLERIMAHEMTAEEKEYAAIFERQPEYKQAVGIRTREATPIQVIKDGVKSPEERKKEKAASKKPRASREGLVSIQDIAEELKMSPKEARSALRKSKTPKPEAGWAWPEDEAKKIKKLLSAA